MGVYVKPESPFWWMLLERRGGKPIRTSTGIPRDGGSPEQNKDLRRQAQEVYAARMTALARQQHDLPVDPAHAEPVRFATLRAWAMWYQTHVIAKNRGAERERELLTVLLAPRRDAHGRSVSLGELALTEVTRERVMEWMTARASTVSARTVNREVDLLKAMLRAAVDHHLLDASPLVGMKRLRVITPKRRLMSPTEERKLLKVADPIDAALIILGVDTLVRFGDLIDLQRDDVQGAWLYIRDPKNPTQGEPYEVPLSVRAQLALKAIPTSTGPYFFSRYRQAKTERDRRKSWRQKLAKICAAAHVPYGRAKGGLTFHWATRRTGATRLLVGRKVPLPVVQKLGHWKTSDVVLEIYSEADRGALLKAVRPESPRNHQPRKTRKNMRKTA